jgi:hypothetical protein
MVHFRALFDELLGREGGRPTAESTNERTV